MKVLRFRGAAGGPGSRYVTAALQIANRRWPRVQQLAALLGAELAEQFAQVAAKRGVEDVEDRLAQRRHADQHHPAVVLIGPPGQQSALHQLLDGAAGAAQRNAETLADLAHPHARLLGAEQPVGAVKLPQQADMFLAVCQLHSGSLKLLVHLAAPLRRDVLQAQLDAPELVDQGQQRFELHRYCGRNSPPVLVVCLPEPPRGTRGIISTAKLFHGGSLYLSNNRTVNVPTSKPASF